MISGGAMLEVGTTMAKGKKPGSKTRKAALAAATAAAPPERGYHDELEHDVQTDMPGVKAQRVVAPIDRLCRGDSLSEPRRQHAAAMAWLEDLEIALGAGGADDLPERIDFAGPWPARELATDRQLAARGRARCGQMTMGSVAAPIVYDVVVRRHPVANVASVAGVDQRRLIGVLDAALSSLADYYGY